MYWDFNGWACNPVPGPQDAQRRVAIIVTKDIHKTAYFQKEAMGTHSPKDCNSPNTVPVKIAGGIFCIGLL